MRDITLPPNYQFGVESVIILAVQWARYLIVPIGVDPRTLDLSLLSWKYYGDKTYEDIPGKILEIDNIESVLNIDGNQSTVAVNITLDDSDSELLKIVNAVDIHKAKVVLYQAFEGLTFSDAFPIFEGEINSDVIWDDAARTLKLAIVSKLEDAEVGFSPEEGDIVDLPEEMVGTPWPMGFGTIVKQKALQITQLPTGITQQEMSIGDESLGQELDRVGGRAEVWNSTAVVFFIAALQALNSGDAALAKQMEDQGNQCLETAAQYTSYTTKLSDIKYEQDNHVEATNKCPIICNWPFLLRGIFDINGSTYEGEITKPKDHIARILKMKSFTNPLAASTGLPDPLDGPPDRAQFVFVPPGSQVAFKGKYPIRYVVNIFGGEMYRVYAYKKYGDLRRLTEVPGVFWKEIHIPVRSIQGGSFSVLGIQLTIALTNVQNGNWDSNDLYITYQSPGGISFASVIVSIIFRYTEFSIDQDSLYSIPDVPINGVLFDKKNIMQFLQEFCWQCKTAIWLREGTFYFYYMGDLGQFAGVLHLSDIISESLQITFSPTENLATKLTGTWHFDFSVEKDNKIIVRSNIDRYGLLERTYSVWAFNDPYAVQSTLSFWIWRYSNTWKRLKFKLPLNWIKLENFDVIAIDQDVVKEYLLSKDRFMWAIVINSFYNTSDNLIEVEVELPYKLGDVHPDDGYWPIFGFNIGLVTAFRYDRNYLGPALWNGKDAVSPPNASVQTVPVSDLKDITDTEGSHMSLAIPRPDSLTGNPKTPGYRAVSDMGGEAGTTPSGTMQIASSSPQPGFVPTPSWKYGYWDIKAPGTPSDSAAGGGQAVPGMVVKQVEKTKYNCILYPDGLKGKAVKGTGILLQKSDPVKDPIPEGTWAIFAKVSRIDTSDGGEAKKIEEYYFQIPIWM